MSDIKNLQISPKLQAKAKKLGISTCTESNYIVFFWSSKDYPDQVFLEETCADSTALEYVLQDFIRDVEDRVKAVNKIEKLLNQIDDIAETYFFRSIWFYRSPYV